MQDEQHRPSRSGLGAPRWYWTLLVFPLLTALYFVVMGLRLDEGVTVALQGAFGGAFGGGLADELLAGAARSALGAYTKALPEDFYLRVAAGLTAGGFCGLIPQFILGGRTGRSGGLAYWLCLLVGGATGAFLAAPAAVLLTLVGRRGDDDEDDEVIISTSPGRRKRRGALSPPLLLAALALAGAGGYAAMIHFYKAPGPLIESRIVEVPKGASVSAIADRLESEGVILNAMAFKIAARLRGDASQLKAGDYDFPAAASLKEVIDAIAEGDAIEHRITIAEGLTTYEALALVEANPILVGEIGDKPGEGALAPETYFVRRGETRKAVIERMKSAQAKILAEAWEKRVEGLPIKSPVEALILASIIEKETGVPSERREVASVFINRLRKGMRLETDPTVIYGITRGAGPLERELTRKDVNTPTDYNTYAIDGLPPTPIANPGRASIEAALDPAETDYLFFVADGSGGHAFAKTFKEHQNNVAKWRKIRAAQRRAEKEAASGGSK